MIEQLVIAAQIVLQGFVHMQFFHSGMGMSGRSRCCFHTAPQPIGQNERPVENVVPSYLLTIEKTN